MALSMIRIVYHIKMDSFGAELSAGSYIVVSQGQDELDAVSTCLADYIVQPFTAKQHSKVIVLRLQQMYLLCIA